MVFSDSVMLCRASNRLRKNRPILREFLEQTLQKGISKITTQFAWYSFGMFAGFSDEVSR